MGIRGAAGHRVLIAIAAALLTAIGGCRDGSRERAASAPAGGDVSAIREPWFEDVAAASGLTFTHFNGMTGEFLYPEIMAPGVALFDFDNDGDLDVFVVQGRMLGTIPIGRALVPPRDPAALR